MRRWLASRCQAPAALALAIAALESVEVKACKAVAVFKHFQAFLAQLVGYQRTRLKAEGLATLECTGNEDEPPLAPRTALLDVIAPDRLSVS